ncbi:MAG: prolyl oligopeptidase family serine peptidase [Candidatus Paceibacterota bacterium]
MRKNIKVALESLPGIISAERISLGKDIEKTFHKKEHVVMARSAARKLIAHKILYSSHHHAVVGFVVKPREHGKKKLPVIIWNRGGYGEHYAIQKKWLFYGTIAQFAKAGYLVLASQYSGNAGSEGVDEFGGNELEDILVFKKLVRECPFADEKKIFMYGESRGGMMTYLALKKARFIRAAVSVAGISDVREKIFKFPLSKKERRERSAVCFAEKFPTTTPLLLMHGTGDTSVPASQSLTLSEKLLRHKKPFELHVFRGDDHFLSHNKTEKVRLSLLWFSENL